MKEHIIYQDHELLVLNKPAGLLSQKDKSGVADAADELKKYFNELGKPKKFIAPVHRLDRNTSGLLLFALNSDAAAKLSEALRNDEIKRGYVAVVKGDPGESGTIDISLSKNEKTNEVRADKYGKRAITHFKRLKKMPATSLLEVWLETGRSHQIRIHFAEKKHALVGDKKYGAKPWSEIFHRPALHANKIIFSHPKTKEELSFEVPMPKDMQELLKKIT